MSTGRTLRYPKTEADAAPISVANDIQDAVKILSLLSIIELLADSDLIAPDHRPRLEPLSFCYSVAKRKRRPARAPS